MSEAKIQQEIYNWFNNNYCLKFHKPRNIIFSVPNETTSFMELKRKKQMGLTSGVSDLIVIIENEVLFVEVKTSTGIISENQKQFRETVERLGFRYYVVRSLKEFQEIILKYKN